MTEWTLNIVYKGKGKQIPAKLIYKSSQIMRFEIKGNRGAITLQTDFPARNKATGPRNVKWKMLQGNFGPGNADSAGLLLNITRELEKKLKESFPPNPLISFEDDTEPV